MKELSLFDTIQTRRSVFPAQYTDGTLEQQDLRAILDAARWAPTHRKTQPWRFAVLQEGALKRLGTFLSEAYAKTEGCKRIKIKKLLENPPKAQAIVLLFLKRDAGTEVPEWEEIAATSMAVQNMWLTAHHLGYGAYWSSPKSFVDISDFDGLASYKGQVFLGFFYIGIRDEDKCSDEQPERLQVEEITTFIHQ